MKGFFSVLLSLFLVLSIVVPVGATGATGVVLSASDLSLGFGDTVTFTVSLNGTTPFKSIGIALQYDENVFEIVSGKWLASNFTINTFNKTLGKAVGAYSEETLVNGNIFSFVLKVKGDAVCDTAGVFADVTLKNGSVSIPTSNSSIDFISVSAPVVLVGKNTIRVKPESGYEYSIDNASWQDSNVFSGLSANKGYTVYQRPKTSDSAILLLDNKITVTTNGEDAPASSDAAGLSWLRRYLLDDNDKRNIAADLNGDYTINIFDLICLKKAAALV